MQPPIVGWLLLFLTVNIGFARGQPLDCKNIQWVGGRPFDLSAVFANGPLNVTVEEETPPSTTITTVLMNLCEPLALDTSIDPSDQCPENTHYLVWKADTDFKRIKLVQYFTVHGRQRLLLDQDGIA
ncbi:hypothetical protein MEQU1_000865 [Malassezia equina]|uniref:Uncharacterized protein n=1 Tax=Malassezia equina TaxID=1381935 RepID=A0AAF0EB38_9BASI|nr:hypothetical protein MEQU1_000865 [Malassezia equina]